MGVYEFKLPDIGEGIAEAEIVAWHVKVGDTVKEDQQLADLMTDKAPVEMESPIAGKVVKVAGDVGDQIPIGSVLVVFETDGEAAAAAPKAGRKDEVAFTDGLVEERPELADAVPSTAEKGDKRKSDRRGDERRKDEERRTDEREQPDRRQDERREGDRREKDEEQERKHVLASPA